MKGNGADNSRSYIPTVVGVGYSFTPSTAATRVAAAWRYSMVSAPMRHRPVPRTSASGAPGAAAHSDSRHPAAAPGTPRRASADCAPPGAGLNVPDRNPAAMPRRSWPVCRMHPRHPGCCLRPAWRTEESREQTRGGTYDGAEQHRKVEFIQHQGRSPESRCQYFAFKVPAKSDADCTRPTQVLRRRMTCVHSATCGLARFRHSTFRRSCQVFSRPSSAVSNPTPPSRNTWM